MKERIAVISVFVNLILAVSKILVGVFVGSVAVLAEGFHSGMDILSCGYKVKHQRGIPCSSLSCPRCSTKLTRDVKRDKSEKHAETKAT